jgi:hypothetical protein
VSLSALLLFFVIPASADTFTLDVTGNAYDVQEFAGFTIAGTGLSIEAYNDFGPGGFGGLAPGQSYTLSYTVTSVGLQGNFDNVWITGNGRITWQFTFVVPIGNTFPTVQVPGTLTGSFSFCSPAVFAEASSCGPDDNPLGSATFAGTGTNTADLACDIESKTCSIYADYLEPFTATANLQTVPEPPTLVLFLGGLPLVCYFLKTLAGARTGPASASPGRSS